MTSAPVAWQFLTVVLAQSNTSAPTAGADAQITSIMDFMIKGGVLMIPITLCSLVALAVIVERMASLRRSAIIPGDFLAGLREAMGSDSADNHKALDYCRRQKAPLARIFATVVDHLHQPEERLEKEVLEAGQRELSGLRKYMRVLSVIANVAPLLGMLGTIFGMITAFQTVAASGEALGRTEALARGIYEALITTAAGLIVAIPTVIAFHWLSAKVEALVAEMDRMVVDFVRSHRAPPNAERRSAPQKTIRVEPSTAVELVPAVV